MYGIETLSIDRVLSKELFYGKIMPKNVHQKLVPDPFLILVNNKTAIACKKFFQKYIYIYFERGLSKSLKKVNFFSF